MITAEKPLDDIFMFLGTMRGQVERIPVNVQKQALELRFRAGRFISVELPGSRYIHNGYIPNRADMDELIKSFCGYSLHSHSRELSEGFITLKGGHRAGFCGTAVIKDGKTETIRDISSVNIRIAREHKGCADEIYRWTSGFGGLLLIGKPLSGKTTVLRDLCRILGNRSKVSVIDERGELAAVRDGIAQNDVGENTDILDGFTKRSGIFCALRSMSPEYVVCDEISGESESVVQCMNSGVKVVLTAHCGSFEEAVRSQTITEILRTGAISHIALCKNERGIFSTEIKTADTVAERKII